MRLIDLGVSRLLPLLAVLILGVSAGPALADAPGWRAKVDPQLLADASTRGPDAKQHVLVLGGMPDTADIPDVAVRHRFHSILAGEALTIPAGRLAELARDPRVQAIVLDDSVHPDSTPLSFPLLASLYPSVDGASQAWNGGYSGAGVGIAVLDSGVSAQPDFGSRLVQVPLPNQSSLGDTYGHGTFVAGVAAGLGTDGRYVGIANGATVYGLNVGRPDGVYSSDVIAGLDWVLANHAQLNIRVINISLSENSTSSYLSNALDTAVERVWQDGVVVVVSSGNRGPNTASYAPANDPFVITVGATDSNDTAVTSDDTVASFSSYGQTQDGYSKPDLLAPGRHIVSVLAAGTTLAQLAPLANLIPGGYGMMSGTSFAAPQVAGAAAVLLEEHPGWSPNQVKALLVQTARSVSGSSARALDLSAATAFTGIPGSANASLVQSTYGLDTSSTGGLTANSWTANSWTANSWNFSNWD